MNTSDLEGKDFIAKYLEYTSGTEVPTFFNRWSCIVGLGAWAMQDIWVPFNSGCIYPNIYAMLVGEPSSRKSTAIKSMSKLLKEAGYSYFAGEKTSKEAFLEDLSHISNDAGIGNLDGSGKLDAVLFGTVGQQTSVATPTLIAADEFSDFFGNNVMEFISMLGVFWDFSGVYRSRVKNGVKIEIPNPNISIMGGNTVETLCRTFPPEALGQGFFSRLLFIYGEPNGRKIAFPREKAKSDTAYMRDELLKMREFMRGEMVISPAANEALKKIYASFGGVADSRFAYYSGRRFIHLLKLVMIHAIADYSSTIELVHVIRANTVLTHTEHYMPRALGEFGRARNSPIVHRILQVLERSHKAMDMGEIWQEVQGDMDKIGELGEALRGLMLSNKIQTVDGGFLPLKQVYKEVDSKLYDWTYLTNEERKI